LGFEAESSTLGVVATGVEAGADLEVLTILAIIIN
jgi:hypothetical protein